MGGANVGSDGFSSAACVRFKREDGGGADKWARAVSDTRGKSGDGGCGLRRGPAQQGRKEERGKTRMGQGNGQQADWAERREGEEKKLSFSYLIFQI
jgi:hypothetical protein